MTLEEIFQDKSIKAKAKVATIGDWLLIKQLPLDELIAFGEVQSPIYKATCIEAVEYATKKQPEIATDNLLLFVTKALDDPEPRVKWESAKVIGNCAKFIKDDVAFIVEKLLLNTTNNGTVVRWATAYALAEILKLKNIINTTLLPKILVLIENEEDNGVKKKYLYALKKIK